MIILVTHATCINWKIWEAPANVVRENLLKYTEKDILYIRHFINWEMKSQFFWYNNKWEIFKKWNLHMISKFSIIRYITEILSTFFYILFFTKSKTITYVWFNPLNSFVWLALRKLRRIQKNICYTPDYSPERFKNKILNKIYHWIDRICVFWSDEVWNVSKRIFDVRKRMWLDISKNIFIPNMPGIVSENNLDTNNFKMITAGNLRWQLDYLWLIDAIAILKLKYKDICFYIAWEGWLRAKIEERIKLKNLEKNVILLGRLDYKDYLFFLKDCSIWIALYNWTFAFNNYWDSMKCREFTCFWMPIITTKFHSTAEEIESNKAWIIVWTDKEWENYVVAFEEIFDNFSAFSKNSKKLWEKYHQYYIDKIKELW